MKPKDKEKLVRNRGLIVRTLDVSVILPILLNEGAFSKKDVDAITMDPRRRYQVTKLLDLLETKKSEVYYAFLDALSEHYPHLYLPLSEFNDDDDDDPQYGAAMEDEWTTLRRTRKFLIQEIDAMNVLPYLASKQVIRDKEIEQIKSASKKERRTEALLDILETKDPASYDHFLDAIGETYPHVYLILTDQSPGDLDDDL